MPYNATITRSPFSKIPGRVVEQILQLTGVDFSEAELRLYEAGSFADAKGEIVRVVQPNELVFQITKIPGHENIQVFFEASLLDDYRNDIWTENMLPVIIEKLGGNE